MGGNGGGWLLLCTWNLKPRDLPLQTRTKVIETLCFILGHLEDTRLLVPSSRVMTDRSAVRMVLLLFHPAAQYLLSSPRRDKAVASHHTSSIAGGFRILRSWGSPFHACLPHQGASSHPTLRCWTSSFWLHLPPRDFSSGEIFCPGITWVSQHLSQVDTIISRLLMEAVKPKLGR